MIFLELELKGAFVIEMEKREDNRGFFARSWCQRQFESKGLNPRVAQVNVSLSKRKGTLRGMHYQIAPYEETKVIRCTKGAIYDVIIDLRPESRTFKQWAGIELNAANRRTLYVPEGFAHGFQTLEDDTEVFYLVSEFYSPGAESGVRWDDPAFGIGWPVEVTVISEKDKSWPDYGS